MEKDEVAPAPSLASTTASRRLYDSTQRRYLKPTSIPSTSPATTPMSVIVHQEARRGVADQFGASGKATGRE